MFRVPNNLPVLKYKCFTSGATGNLRLPGKVASALKLSGFVDISAVRTVLIKLF